VGLVTRDRDFKIFKEAAGLRVLMGPIHGLTGL
jgi:hypothetical protein